MFDKKAFSLTELMIVLLIASLFVAASIPILTKKHYKIPAMTEHGTYLCYYGPDGKLRQYHNNSKLIVSGTDIQNRSTIVDNCIFNPPKNAAYYQISAVGGGGGGGDSGYNGGRMNSGWSKEQSLYPFGVTEEKLAKIGITPTDFKKATQSSLYIFAKGPNGGYGGNANKMPTTCENKAQEVCEYDKGSSATDVDGNALVEGACTGASEGKNCITETVQVCPNNNYKKVTKQSYACTDGNGKIIEKSDSPQTAEHCVIFGNSSFYPTVISEDVVDEEQCNVTWESKVITHCHKCKKICQNPKDTCKYQAAGLGGGARLGGACYLIVNGELDLKGLEAENVPNNIPHYFFNSSNLSINSNDNEDIRKISGGNMFVGKSNGYPRSEEFATDGLVICKNGTIGTSCSNNRAEITTKILKTDGTVYKSVKAYGASMAGSGAKRTGPMCLDFSLDPNNPAETSGECPDNENKITVYNSPIKVDANNLSESNPDLASHYYAGYATTFNTSTALSTHKSNGHGYCANGTLEGDTSSLAKWEENNAVQPSTNRGKCNLKGPNGYCVYHKDDLPRRSNKKDGGFDKNYIYQYYFNENYLQHGNPGAAGEYKSLVVRSFKDMDTTIRIGRGGSAGKLKTGSAGTNGSATSMGTIIYAAGGKGGEGGIIERNQILPIYKENEFNDEKACFEDPSGSGCEDIEYKYHMVTGGAEGEKPLLKGLSANLFNYVLPQLKDAIAQLFESFGHGGRGGGVTHSCWAGNQIVILEDKYMLGTATCPQKGWFVGTNRKRVTCSASGGDANGKVYSDSTGNIYGSARITQTMSCDPSNDYIVNEATDGTDGALLIRW